MILRDTFSDWEGAVSLVQGVLIVNGQAVWPNQAWFLRVVRATKEERQALYDAGYVLKDAALPQFCRVLC
jgi:hypothetical protein